MAVNKNPSNSQVGKLTKCPPLQNKQSNKKIVRVIKMSFIGKHVSALPTPAFIIDKEKVEMNCKKMLDLAR